MDTFTTGVDSETGGADCKNPWGALNVAFGISFLKRHSRLWLAPKNAFLIFGLYWFILVYIGFLGLAPSVPFLLGFTQLVLLLLA